ncbi:MAG: ABC transporter ATP-binding protein [Armatimonadota bacterium]|nr:ABC transporter ATP-binding protein [Armatimonadota bacterium]MDR7486804.1 ABC transporter ATP-binding protein [Armatimonadota bacterium]MDR7533857.1 ABC transporter ATP-binding protein [Armatimonadota bacterium]MDR7535105.1 ABC transporter ATP-binding protein [Armatimonadota bacterium]
MLRVRDLEVRYGEARALEGIDLTVGDGEVVAVLGPNGVGKSTLVKSIAGWVKPWRGTVEFLDAPITGLPPDRVCERGIAIVPEGRRVFGDLTVQENLELGAFTARARGRARETMEHVLGLFPRLRERLGQRAGSLSGGEQQMLAIGRALMSNPRLLLMDEPSLGLAPVMADVVFGFVGEIRRLGVSVLLVEQNAVRALAVADRAAVMERGRVVLQGTREELMRTRQVQEAYLGVS